jgi:hypothetical protein
MNNMNYAQEERTSRPSATEEQRGRKRISAREKIDAGTGAEPDLTETGVETEAETET